MQLSSRLGALFAVASCVATGAFGQGYTTFEVPGAAATLPYAMDSNGNCAGFYIADPAHFVRQGFYRTAAGVISTFDPPDSVDTEVTGMSVAGTVGFFESSNGAIHGFLRSPSGAITVIDHPNSPITFAWDINATGTIAGMALLNGVVQSFLRSPAGVFTDFAVPNSVNGQPNDTEARAINGSGTVTGMFTESGLEGFVRNTNGALTLFTAVPGSGHTEPMSINASGQTAGYYFGAISGLHGFVRSASGSVTSFDFPGDPEFIQDVHIADNGAVAGNYTDRNTYLTHGFTRDPSGQFTTIDQPGSLYTEIHAMNATGGFVGDYVGSDAVAHGFVFLPRTIGPNLDLAPGQTAVISNTSFHSNVTLAAGSSLVLNNSQATGNVTLNGGSITVNGGSLGNNLQGTGNVTVNNAALDNNLQLDGGTLSITGGSIGNNLQLQGSVTFSLVSVTVKGDLTVQNQSATFTVSKICGSTFHHVTVEKSAGPLQIGAGCAGNTIGGDLMIHKNYGAIAVDGNHVIGNLRAQQNRGPVDISANTIGKDLQCSANTSTIVGSGNTAKSKSGQCMAF
jgi:hypothetical protein